jgi:1-acyl-sn-glycerol-3-phosphate acyltransferase
MGDARFTFGLRLVDTGDDGVSDPSRPLLVFSRHAGAGDSFLLVDEVANGPHRRRPLIVLKDFLQLDPLIDVLLHRVGASFVRPGSGDEAAEAIGRLATSAGPGDAVILFPEGGNFSPERRERAIAKLDLIGRPDLAARAEHLVHLLPPKPLGVSTAIDAARDADVAFVGHTGLETLSTPADIWRNLPTRLDVHTRIWRVRAEDVPPPDGREDWLYGIWQQIDDWTDTTMVSEAGAP